MDPFSGFLEGFQNARKLRDERQNSSIDALIKQAQLRELGYDITPKKGGFFGGGGYEIHERPDYISSKALERQKLQAALEDIPGQRALRGAKTTQALAEAKMAEAAVNGFGGQEIPTFASEEEADARGYEGPAIINGQRGIVKKKVGV